MLSLGIDILHVDDLAFREEQIYGINYMRCPVLMKHKKYENTYVEVQGFFFLSIGIDGKPDYA